MARCAAIQITGNTPPPNFTPTSNVDRGLIKRAFVLQTVVVDWFDMICSIWCIILQEYIALNDGSVGVFFWRTWRDATSLRRKVEPSEAECTLCTLP